MYMTHRYQARLVAASTISGSDGAKMIVLKIRRPVMFDFKPGQYACLRLRKIDIHWHPFSIASGPGAPNLEFYIEVFGEKSWTCKLWNILNPDNSLRESDLSNLLIDIEVLGPYGTSLGKTEDFSHAIAIGAGTGTQHALSCCVVSIIMLLTQQPLLAIPSLVSYDQMFRSLP
jgi:NAD(P)H-flavin reductase